MRPADHPDFFRLPPPPGASRQSRIRLDREGRFWHEGELVEHAPLEQALRTWVAAHPDDGRPILTNGYDWVDFEVDDAPLRADAVSFEGAPDHVERVLLHLFDGSIEEIAPGSLTLDGDVVYARLPASRGDARHPRAGLEVRFSRHAQGQLAQVLVSADPPTIEIAGERYELPTRRR